uniref:Uncharacterized protein n=1 Tax=Arundo donax TaxID=35708 RepID=A0A0A9EE70_ARUDO
MDGMYSDIDNWVAFFLTLQKALAKFIR